MVQQNNYILNISRIFFHIEKSALQEKLYHSIVPVYIAMVLPILTQPH